MNSNNFNKQYVLKVATLNMCGLRRRAKYPDFAIFVVNYELLCFTEIKTDDTDIISFQGYISFDQPRIAHFYTNLEEFQFILKINYRNRV